MKVKKKRLYYYNLDKWPGPDAAELFQVGNIYMVTEKVPHTNHTVIEHFDDLEEAKHYLKTISVVAYGKGEIITCQNIE